MFKIIEHSFYIKPEEKKEIKTIVKNKQLDKPIETFLSYFKLYLLNKPSLRLFKKENSDKSILKIVGLFNERTNNNLNYLFYNEIRHLKKYEDPQKRYKIIVNNVDGIRNFIKGSILDNGVEIVIFEIASTSLFLYDLINN